MLLIPCGIIKSLAITISVKFASKIIFLKFKYSRQTIEYQKAGKFKAAI